MPDTPVTIGAEVRCTDGACGKVTRVMVDPLAHAITHLVVGPRHEPRHARLVPVDLVETTTDKVQLRCTKAEFEKLDPAEETNFVESSEQPRDVPDRLFYLHAGAGLGTVSTPAGLSGVWTEGHGWDLGGQHGPVRRTITYDSVPPGRSADTPRRPCPCHRRQDRADRGTGHRP